jgi:hypothetical protein
MRLPHHDNYRDDFTPHDDHAPALKSWQRVPKSSQRAQGLLGSFGTDRTQKGRAAQGDPEALSLTPTSARQVGGAVAGSAVRDMIPAASVQQIHAPSDDEGRQRMATFARK